jgi:hypothetical protein
MRYEYREHIAKGADFNLRDLDLQPGERVASHTLYFYKKCGNIDIFLIEKPVPFRSRIRTRNKK